MGTSKQFIEYVTGQIKDAGIITYRKMFGEYALYSNNKVVALICDNQFFAKPIPQITEFVGDCEMAPPYPGAKNHYLITDQLEDTQWISELIRISERYLPERKPKKPKKI
ncbi:MAG: TfoX/Sxy family protein [Deltaproteobacteria bacterium]|nr:TfoX/Sxy family protein [Deltaproteobacteria bacterium]